MAIIKKEILITVSYLVEADPDSFWDAKSGYVDKSVRSTLDTLFPEHLDISDTLSASRNHISHQILGRKNGNSQKCSVCGKWIADYTKPSDVPVLLRAVTENGVTCCSGCAWELGFDKKLDAKKESGQ
ncbi:MAG: hypothetical protein ACK5LX_11125 [Oscillospiraceae bacterium]